MSICMCVLILFNLGCCLGLKFVIVKFFFVQLLKFISDFKSIKFFMAFEKINNIVERSKCKFIKINC